MAPHSSTLAWKIPWMEEPGRLQSVGSQRVRRLRDFTFTFHFHALEKAMATHSSVLAWRIPGMGEPVGLPSMGSHRVGHDWSDFTSLNQEQNPGTASADSTVPTDGDTCGSCPEHGMIEPEILLSSEAIHFGNQAGLKMVPMGWVLPQVVLLWGCFWLGGSRSHICASATRKTKETSIWDLNWE